MSCCCRARKTHHKDSLVEDSYGQAYLFSIAVVDLDPKTVSKLEKVYLDDSRMVATACWWWPSEACRMQALRILCLKLGAKCPAPTALKWRSLLRIWAWFPCRLSRKWPLQKQPSQANFETYDGLFCATWQYELSFFKLGGRHRWLECAA